LILVFAICIDIVLAGLAAQAGVVTQVFAPVKAVHSETASYGWYYQPRTDGRQPNKNTEMAFIEKYGAYSVGDPDEKVIYITFDAGFENGYTPQILDALKKHNAPAAFFVVGHYIESNPELVRRMAEEGHLVCNHTMYHRDMTQLTELEAFRREITGLEDVYRDATGGQMPRFYRPPEGKFSERNLQYAQQMGYTTVFWSFAYCDWYVDDQPGHAFAMDKILSRTHPGEVALLHSTSETNAQILDDVLTEWQRMGYRFENLYHLTGEVQNESCEKRGESVVNVE